MANVVATFTANISGYTKAMKDMQDSTGRANSGIKSTLSSSGGGILKLGALFGVAAKVGSSAMSAIGNGIRGMYTELNESSKAWQTFESNMKFLGKTPAQISSIEKSLQSYAQKTIYSSSDMASAYAQFASVGVKGVGNLVKGMGGLAAATDDPKQAMKTLMEQGTQMAAKPMVQWADFRLMLEQTPAGMAAVAKAMGMTTKELVQNVQNGKVSTQQFFDGIEKAGNSKAFQKMATSYKTVGEAMDGLQETMANKLQPAWQAMSKVAVGAISGIIDKVGTINFDSVIASIGKFFSPFSSLILNIKTQLSNLGKGDSMSGLISVLQGVGSVLQTIFSLVGSLANVAFVNLIGIAQKVGGAFNSAFGNGQMSGLFNGIKQAVTDFGVVAMEAMTTVGNFIANLPWKAIFDGVKVALSGVLAVLKPFAAIVKAAFANDIVKSFAVAILGAVGAFKVIGLAIGGFSSVIGVFSKIIGPIRGVISVVTNFGTIVKTAGGVWKAFGLILGMNPWVLLIAGIAAVVAGLVYFFTQTKTGQKIWSEFVSGLKSMWNGLASFFSGLWNGITQTFNSAAKGVQNGWNSVTTFFSNLWTGIVNGATSAWNGLTSFLSGIWNGIVNIATSVWGGISSFFSGLWQGIVSVATGIWNTFGPALTTIWQGIVSIATGVWNMLKAVIMGPILIVLDFLTGSWTQLGTDLQLIWTSIVMAAGQIWTGLVTYFSGVWDLITTYAQTSWNLFTSVIEAVWNGIVSGASAIWNALGSFFSGLWSGIVSTTVGAWNSVASFLSGLWSGTVSTAEGIWNALPGFFSGLWSGITSFFSSAWSSISSIVMGAASSIVNGARSVWSGFTGIVSNVVNGIRNGFNALRNINLLDAGRAIMDSFFSGLTAAWSKVQSFVGGIASWIRQHKGPISYDAKLLIPAGNAIMGGLNQGLQKSFGAVQKTVSGMASDISDNMSANISSLSMAGTQFSSGDVTQSIDASERITPNIYVQNNVDKNGINSMVKEADANDAAVSSYFRPIGG